MVNKTFIHTVLKLLEKYLIRRSGFMLSEVCNYDLILFIPVDRFATGNNCSIMVGAKMFDNWKQKDTIFDILTYLREFLSDDDYNSISRVNIIHTEDPLVKNLRFVFAFREEIIEIKDYPIGGVMIENAFLVKSLVLDKFVTNQVFQIEIKNYNNLGHAIIQAGIYKVLQDFTVLYFTHKGIYDIYQPKNTEKEKKVAAELGGKDDKFWLKNGYLEKVSFDDIVRIVE